MVYKHNNMYQKVLWFFIFIFLTIHGIKGQVTGYVYDQKGHPIPYATVYVQGTTIGTVSNEDGFFFLDLSPGEYTIVVSYVGYTEKRKTIKLEGKRSLQFDLAPQIINLDAVTIHANAEDPAYRVIRKAIKARKKHRNAIKKYSADLYIKGIVKLLKTPKKVFGQEVGNLGGMVDSTGRGIVYQSESKSHIYHISPDLYKEEMYSSIVAGDDSGINANQFQDFNFNIYDSHFDFGRSFVNPLADNALMYYKYRLDGTSFDHSGAIINHITIIPKSPQRPLFGGKISIVEDTWQVKNLALFFTGKAANQPIIDTVSITQIHQLLDGDRSIIHSQIIRFSGGVFGIRMGGSFSYIFRDFDFDPPFDESFFDEETFVMQDGASNQDTAFWMTQRPIPLTEEERKNYIKTDSLKRIWKSKSFLDSISRAQNKFRPVNLLTGYSYHNYFRHFRAGFSSPLSYYAFHPVSGHTLGLSMSIEKTDTLDIKSLFNLKNTLHYGFSDKRLKFDLTASGDLNKKMLERWSFSIGDQNFQYDGGSIPDIINTASNLFLKKNQAKVYRKKYIAAGYGRELFNGFYASMRLGYSKRYTLDLRSDFSIFYKGKQYGPNRPSRTDAQELDNPADDLNLALNVTWNPGQKYNSFPHFRIRQKSKWPTLSLSYSKGIRGKNRTDYDKVKLRISREYINYHLVGHGHFMIEGGTFLNRHRINYMDRFHFSGNRYLVALNSQFFAGYRLMPYNEYSTTSDYISAHYDHHFDGFFMDLIPGIKKLGWETVLSGKALFRTKEKPYYEISAGISDIKIGVFNLFRIDYVWSFDHSGLLDRGIVIGLSSLFESSLFR